MSNLSRQARIVRALAILGIGTALGLASAVFSVRSIGNAGSLRVGAWATPLDAGSAARGPYLRAAVALGATLALSRQETLYFSAIADDDGKKLIPTCAYTLDGTDLPSRWWSVTLYDQKHYLIINPQNKYSYASANIAHDTPGHFQIVIDRTHHDGNWLNPADAAGLVLVTRVYQPNPDAAASPASIALPHIKRGACT